MTDAPTSRQTPGSPLVSVIIPCFNAGKFVMEAIESVLRQDCQELEIIVVNDGSTDESTNDLLRCLAMPKTRVITQTNAGPAAARNRGISESNGKYFLPLDADDTIEPSYLSKAVSILENDASTAFVYTEMHYFGAAEFVRPREEYNFYKLLFDNIVTACALTRREVWQAVGGYDEAMRGGYEDWEFWISLGEAGHYGKLIHEPLLRYRRLEDSRQTGARRCHDELVRMIREKHPLLYFSKNLDKLAKTWKMTGAPRWRFNGKVWAKNLFRTSPLLDRWRTEIMAFIYGGLRKIARKPDTVSASIEPTADRNAPTVSVIMPCYNQGQFVEEAIDSVFASDFQDFEIIVINDGSTDQKTNEVLAALNKPQTRVLNQVNQGLAMARNNGIKEARGKYFLALDADDTIEPSYLGKAVKILEAEPALGFVYPYAHLFGDVDYVWRPMPYNFYVLLWEQIVFGCAVVRKAAWAEVDGYNRNMIYGYEDWDFWIGLGQRGWFGRQIPEALVNYRKHGVTMQAAVIQKRGLMIQQIRKNHPEIYGNKKLLRELRLKWFKGNLKSQLWLLSKRVWWSRYFPGWLRPMLQGIINR